MEDLLSRLESIQQLVSLFGDREKENFNKFAKDKIKSICEITDQIEKEVSTVPIDSTLLEEKNAEFYRQKIISKAIFAHYWSLITFLNGKDLAGLKELDKVKNIVNNNYV